MGKKRYKKYRRSATRKRLEHLVEQMRHVSVHPNVAFTPTQHWQLVRAAMGHRDLVSVDVSTFRTGTSQNFLTAFDALRELAREAPIRLLVGTLRSSPDGENGDPMVEGILQGLRKKKNLEARTIPDFHTKLWIFNYKTHSHVLVGGRNLTLSTWHDLSIMITDATVVDTCRRAFECYWTAASAVADNPFITSVMEMLNGPEEASPPTNPTNPSNPFTPFGVQHDGGGGTVSPPSFL